MSSAAPSVSEQCDHAGQLGGCKSTICDSRTDVDFVYLLAIEIFVLDVMPAKFGSANQCEATGENLKCLIGAGTYHSVARLKAYANQKSRATPVFGSQLSFLMLLKEDQKKQIRKERVIQ